MLNVPLDSDTAKDDLKSWPKGLAIRGGTYDAGIWTEDPGFREALQFQRWTRELLRDQHRNDPHSRDRLWILQFTVPAERRGQTLYFQAEYLIPDIGLYSSPLSAAGGRILLSVVEPCSEADRARAAGTHVRAANAEGAHYRAIVLADSLIAFGWHDLAGLEAATQSATFVAELEKSLNYLDLNYRANGRVNVFDSSLTPDAALQSYLKKRDRKLEMIRQQQQR